MKTRIQRFFCDPVRLGQVTLIFLLAVIAWGAFVRASGSGAGCGSHWPLCNGQVLPLNSGTKTLIEFTHRITSGVSLILCVALGWSTFRRTPRRSWTRKAGVAAVVLILTEALLGAGLVLLELVEENRSLLRTLSLGIHLLNTFLLIGSVVLVVRWFKQESSAKLQMRPWAPHLGLFTLSTLGTLGIFALGASGAMTALGDTLFPATTVAEGLRQDLSPTSHFLIKLRIIHPLIAVAVTSYLLGFSLFLKRRFEQTTPEIAFFAMLLAGTLVSQLLLGVMNILLLAPTAIQLGHLLLADCVWLLWVQLLAAVWVQPEKAFG